MKTLYVLRHAKSDWGDSALKDVDRPLNDRGRKAARAMGKEMRKRKVKPDLVLASPAARVKETLERVRDGYGEDFDVTEDPRLYAAEVPTLIEILRGAPDKARRLMIVGHNPGFQELVLELTDGPADLREEVAEGLPTAALVEIGLDVKGWNEIRPGTGRIENLTKPRDL